LFNPDKVKKLANTFGPEFTKLYYQYVGEKLYEKEIDAVTLFKKILDVQLSVGNPYLVFKDHVNTKSNLRNYAPVRSSNLCVAGSTRVLTEIGYMCIDEMVDEDVQVWNGKEWSEVTIRKTGENQPLKRLHFNNGLYLDCTPTHKFYIQRCDKKEAEQIDACELKRGMILEKFDITIIVLDVDAVDENRCSRIRQVVIRAYRLRLFADYKVPFISLTCNI
jgi:ribonucleoside-diphosphate reductase alpha chain